MDGGRYSRPMAFLSGAGYWQRRLARWRPRAEDREPGYTLLLPVPGDIPVFLELALRVCALQRSRHRVRTVVIPDRPSRPVRSLVMAAQRDWEGPLDLVFLPHPERWALPFLRSGSRNHGLQLITGINATASSHVVLHDADLFLLDDVFLDSQYVMCRDRNLACLGVSPVWDPWYAGHGRHLAATWEMTAEVAWLLQYTPYQQIGHDDELFGETHTFDTTLYPQATTEPDRIDVFDRGQEFVHFNYVISSYRDYQRTGRRYLDTNFRILLVSMFAELFSRHGWSPPIPTVAEMARGLSGPDGPVRYPSRAVGAEEYAEFRGRFSRALAGPYLSTEEADRAVQTLRPFDDFYGLSLG